MIQKNTANSEDPVLAILKEIEKKIESIDTKVKKSYLSVDEASVFCSVSKGTIWNLISSGKLIPRRPVSGCTRIKLVELEELMDQSKPTVRKRSRRT